MPQLFYPDPLIRIPFYIALGLVTEVIFTGVMDLIAPNFLQSWRLKNAPAPEKPKADPRAMGYSFLWMIPLYGLLVGIEPMQITMTSVPLIFRGLIYLAAFWVGEYLTGALLKRIIGFCPWDYSNSRFSVHSYIRWDFGPFWYVFTLFLDRFTLKLVALTPAIKALF